MTGAAQRQVIIVGAGGHARVCADAAASVGAAVLGFCAHAPAVGTLVNGIPVLARDFGGLKQSRPLRGLWVVIAIGDDGVRRTLYEEAQALGCDLLPLVHPTAVISPSASLGSGTVVMPGVIVNANAVIGRYCILNTASSIDHDNRLGDGVQISPGVRSAGGVTIGDMAFIGTGAVLIPGVTIGAGAVVGAGAAVTADVAAGARVGGVPARPLG
jgi:UDP-perosamine 4-acetyltransferase